MFSRLPSRVRLNTANHSARSLHTLTSKQHQLVYPSITVNTRGPWTSPRCFSTPASEPLAATTPPPAATPSTTKPETPVEKVIREVKEEQKKEADSIPLVPETSNVAHLNSENQPAKTASAPSSSATSSSSSSASTTGVGSVAAGTPAAGSGSAAAEKSEKSASASTAQSNEASTTLATTTTTTTTAVGPPAEPKKPLLQRIKDEAHHIYLGMKLLAAETRISSRLLVKLMKGIALSRREGLQLKRTVADLLRLVPMMIIILIPFLELALPLLLYIFPNMLPSTFESKFQAEEKKKKLLKVRLEMAKFLQETVAEVSVTGTARAQKAKEFSDFFQKYRTTGILAPTDQVLAIAKKFQDDLTLNSLSRPQLISMARYMNQNAFGTDAYLRSQINDQLVSLKRDDSLIAKEGVDNLTIPELQTACNNRGIKIVGVSPARLKSELMQWLDLHLTHGVPGSLLILSRAFTISEKIPTSSDEALKGSAEALQQTLSALPQQVVHEAQLQVSEVAGTATRSQKLNVIKEQEELIEDELEQDKEIAAANAVEASSAAAASAAAAAAEPALAASSVPSQPTVSTSTTTESATPAATAAAATNATAATAVKANSDSESVSNQVDIPKDQLKKVGDAIKVMVSGSALDDVKAELQGLKEETKEYREDIDELKQLTQKEPPRTVSAVSSRVNKMIASLEAEIAKIDSEIGSSMNVIQPDAAGNLSVEELQNALNLIKDNPGDERIKKIVKRLDRDGDGVVTIPEVLAFVSEVEMQTSAAGSSSGGSAGAGSTVAPASSSGTAAATTSTTAATTESAPGKDK
ncbi:LETM1-like protein-domain-containing protein [Chytriomyces cf. hyalinus JEL632]|nr:LETM1-like protein-domain-containing protein [Chytriomyces cf. hyalinus JEL632]